MIQLQVKKGSWPRSLMTTTLTSLKNLMVLNPANIADKAATDDDRQIVGLILEKYKNHPSILLSFKILQSISIHFLFMK